MTDRVTTPFGTTSSAAEVLAGVDLTGRRAVVTGGGSGIGRETARALAAAGAEVTAAVRDPAAADLPHGVTAAPLDLADQASVRAFTDAWIGPLHILVNNAGIMAAPLTRTAEGWELQFATNHIGHFTLAMGLHAALGEAIAEDGEARVVSVSSVGHLNGGIDFDDIHFTRRPYDPWAAYSQSKTANILFAVEAAKRWAPDGITVNALTPGRIRTNLMRHLPAVPEAPAAFEADNPDIRWKSLEQGAATSVLLAGSPLLRGVSGRYFEDGSEAPPQRDGIRRGVAAHALDPEAAARLWELFTP